MVGIYAIKNKVNGKIYIGQSTNIENRWYKHKTSLRHNYHGNYHLQCSWNKYGEDSFEFSVLEECAKDKLDEREIYWINYFGGCESDDMYNNRDGGKGGGKPNSQTMNRLRVARLKQDVWNKGLTKDDPRVAKYCMKPGTFHHTEETKLYISKLIKQRHTEGVYDNVDYSKRTKMSKEKYDEIRKKNTGRKRSSEQCKNISDGKKRANAEKIAKGLPTRINKKPTPMKTSICAVCGKEFQQRVCRYKKTCSNECKKILIGISNRKE